MLINPRIPAHRGPGLRGYQGGADREGHHAVPFFVQMARSSVITRPPPFGITENSLAHYRNARNLVAAASPLQTAKDFPQQRDAGVDFPVGKMGKRVFAQSSHGSPLHCQCCTAGVGERSAFPPPVASIDPPRHETVCFKAIENADERRPLDPHELREIRLCYSFRAMRDRRQGFQSGLGLFMRRQGVIDLGLPLARRDENAPREREL